MNARHLTALAVLILSCALPSTGVLAAGNVHIDRTRAVFSLRDFGEVKLKPLKASTSAAEQQEANRRAALILELTGVRCRTMNLLSGIQSNDAEGPSMFIGNLFDLGLRTEQLVAGQQNSEDRSRAVYRLLTKTWKPVGGMVYETVNFSALRLPQTLVEVYLCRS